MADVARCRCPHDCTGAKCGRNLDCPIHGFNGADPKIPYDLSFMDKMLLRSMKIDPFDSTAIQATRQADEDRFKRD